jgi:hypothetical protein
MWGGHRARQNKMTNRATLLVLLITHTTASTADHTHHCWYSGRNLVRLRDLVGAPGSRTGLFFWGAPEDLLARRSGGYRNRNTPGGHRNTPAGVGAPKRTWGATRNKPGGAPETHWDDHRNTLGGHRNTPGGGPKHTGRFLIRLCDLVGEPRGRPGPFFRLPGRGGHLPSGVVGGGPRATRRCSRRAVPR